MRVRLGFLAVWTATTAAGVGITWVGVGDAMRGTALPVPDAAAEVPVIQGRPPSATADPVRDPAASTPSPTRSSARPWPKASTPGPGPAKPTKPVKPTVQQSPTSRPEPSPAPQGEVRTYVVASGRVVLSFTEDAAKLVSATPDSGFEVKVWKQTEWLRVDLTDGVRGSAVFATWNGHPPLVEVYEY
ncbi:hypothetical protein EDD29_8300 [Actinocorallia herbida]|uniref:Secreted protein n=1 Tax=Actinocorallia herbida TaxID=58109 RepID=A0A3N1DAP9_9ACTN|nr:hypothetical protein [Actinocorallia herbida]ROO90569.1 hypothetical protein EDD29_8300 [Actinocorallia herbida]